MTPPPSDDSSVTHLDFSLNWEPPHALTARLRLAAMLAAKRGGWGDTPFVSVLRNLELDPEEIPVTDERIEIGREAGLALLLSASGLSRVHFALWKEGSVWMIEDLGSRNGTLLNGELVTEATPVRDADWIEAGHVLFVPHLPAADEPKTSG